MGVHWFWWMVIGPLAVLTLWVFVDSLVFASRRATTKFAAVQSALQRPVVRTSAFLSSLDWTIDDRVIAVRSAYVGSGGSVRGMRGHLFVLATPLRVSAWAMHDLQVRQERSRSTWDDRFTCIESGVPVREGWLTDTVRANIAHFFDNQLAAGVLRTDRGELQHAAYWSAVGDTSDPAVLRDLLARFALVAAALDRAATRRHPMG
ncbi:hypothetical protein [Luteitalea sp.]|jgi:hypothetical protein|uniref:hypothetical protein n=1 Tax=Luteitalea sp. TaxID=2004800 RepID=UPI0037C63825